MLEKSKYKTHPGLPFPSSPFGAIIEEGGVMFRIFSRNATRVWLMLFNDPEDLEPDCEIEFSPTLNRSGDIWHMFVEGLKSGQLYLYRMEGPFEPDNGQIFNARQWLIDPYSKAVTGINRWGELKGKKDQIAKGKKDRDYYKKLIFAGLAKCVIVDDRFDWEGDRPLHYSPNETIIYEAHLRGLTVHPDNNFVNPGTFKGLTEIIPHLKELGITTLELLPVQEFNELEIFGNNPVTREPLLNYWGYSTVGFFAPNGQYSSSGVIGEQVVEFKKMVKLLHKAGIEIILDVVFNHTAEGNDKGPAYSFKGIDNSVYYMLEDNNKRKYKNYTGCGNTVNCNHPYVRRFIVNCLRYWVLNMHVDGFRFDLASVLGRDQQGKLMQNPPLLEEIADDPVLRNTKLIAEAWDAGGAYQVGSFPGERWAEWNGKFRDDVRAFLKGDKNSRSSFAYRLSGSSDLYMQTGRAPVNSINFITSHDGFTLNDLVSFNNKHNEANGENNRDGDDNNKSYNYGEEGDSDNPDIVLTRIRQIKNFLTILLLSQGVPMLTAGDEFRRTQKGNNNAYCQDSEISWIDWNLKEKNGEIFRFCKQLISLRKNHPVFRRTGFFTGRAVDLNNIADITWFDYNGKKPDWNEQSCTLAFLIHGRSSIPHTHISDDDFFVMINSENETRKFVIPKPPNKGQWYVAVNTARPSPFDINDPGTEPSVYKDATFWTVARSIVILKSKVK